MKLVNGRWESQDINDFKRWVILNLEYRNGEGIAHVIYGNDSRTVYMTQELAKRLENAMYTGVDYG